MNPYVLLLAEALISGFASLVVLVQPGSPS
jgi:hypothetical protein